MLSWVADLMNLVCGLVATACLAAWAGARYLVARIVPGDAPQSSD